MAVDNLCFFVDNIHELGITLLQAVSWAQQTSTETIDQVDRYLLASSLIQIYPHQAWIINQGPIPIYAGFMSGFPAHLGIHSPQPQSFPSFHFPTTTTTFILL